MPSLPEALASLDQLQMAYQNLCDRKNFVEAVLTVKKVEIDLLMGQFNEIVEVYQKIEKEIAEMSNAVENLKEVIVAMDEDGGAQK